MALSYQVSCAPGSLTTIADMVTLGGGGTITLTNHHATEVLLIGGDVNENTDGSKARIPTTLTVATGYRIAAGDSFTTVLAGGEIIYGRGGNSTATCSVSVFRTNYIRGGQSQA